MQDKIEKEILDIYKKLEKAGFEAYIVGGSVRDLLMDRQVKDWDLATNATPEQIQSIFPQSFYDNAFGTVGIPIKEDNETKEVVEITTYRKESVYRDMRHPESVEWGKSIEDDLSRRDFSMNAVAVKLALEENRIEDIEFVDPYNGKEDIKSRLIKAVRDPNERFKEDALRLMRAIRLAAQLGFEIENRNLSRSKRRRSSYTACIIRKDQG
jgi:tRNA nucleotidyltransferase (CCA-adding enzyme)